MADGTSQDEVKTDVKENEPTGDDTPQKTELDSYKEALEESKATLKRYSEVISGSQKGFEELATRVKSLEGGKKTNPNELHTELPVDEGLSAEDKEYRNYLKKLGVYTKSEVENMVQERIAPFQAQNQARVKMEQKQVIDEFVKSRPNLSPEKDPDGKRFAKIIDRIKRIAPADPSNPNFGLKEDLDIAYKWALEEEINQEALSKAKAEGRAEGHEASETQVGEGSSVSQGSTRKQRTSAQEEVLRDWGVDDGTYLKR